ncbi:protein FAM210B, mitochondrial [Salarias fasciatus]|uniref:DUF1279 domain-containing protein n=1 Tax=Salarias fasciatus TaxID=181472 RepID=A0A672GVT4_SALFA|nr:protein FAM210B, mitochondrial [Salarias fasciatus]
MFLRRAGRLSAAVRDQAFKSARAPARRPGGVALTARIRGSCASAARLDPPSQPHLGRQDLFCGFPAPVWARSDLVSLPGGSRREGGGLDVIRQPLFYADRRHNGGAEPAARVLFTVSSGSSRSTMTVQTRSSSTSAAAKRSGAGEERADGDKGNAQTLKEDSTTSSTAKGPEDPEPEGGKPSKTQQLKKVFKEYGAVGVSFHIGISLMSLGMFYLLISSGIDMAAILCKLGFSEAVVQSKMAAGTSTFVLAYAIHKLFAPVRISITLVSVPLIVRYFRKTGLFKPPTPAP